MICKRVFQRGLLAAAFFAAALPAAAQSFPNRPLKLIVPYAAGGGTDAIARLVAQAVGEKLGQAVIVENNGSAGGNVASQLAASSPADGYTLLMANQGPMVVNPHLFKHVKVDPLKAFEPVTLITSAPLALVVPTKSPFKTAEEFLAFVRANPNKLSYGSAGNGSASHLATVLLARLGKFEATHVPYRGAGPALNDLVSGQTDFMVTTMPSVVGLVTGGAVRALGVSTEERVERFPDLPTLGESVPGYATGAWYGFVTPKGTPADVNTKLREATVAAINTQVVRERFAAEGAKPIGSTPEAFQKMMADESKRWAEIIAGTSIVVN